MVFTKENVFSLRASSSKDGQPSSLDLVQSAFSAPVLAMAWCGVCYGASLGVLSSFVARHPMSSFFKQSEGSLDFGAGALWQEALHQTEEVVSFAISQVQDHVEQTGDVVRFAQESLSEVRNVVDETEVVARKLLDVVGSGQPSGSIEPVSLEENGMLSERGKKRSRS